MAGSESGDDKSGPDWPPFEGWIRPSAALKSAPWNYDTTAKWVHVRLKNGSITAGFLHEGERRIIPKDMWEKWPCIGDTHFWKTGDVTFYRNDIPSRYRELYDNVVDFELTDVRFEPTGFVSQLPGDADLSSSPKAEKPVPEQMTGFDGPRIQDRGGRPTQEAGPAPSQVHAAATKRRGRPAGKYGEPIARITVGLMAKPQAELARYTAESLGLELIEEFKRLGLSPPSEDNAARDAAGILKVVRK